MVKKVHLTLVTGGLTVVLVAMSGVALAEPAKASPGGTVSVTIENDIVADEDRDYTNGIRFDYVSPRNDLPWAGRFARRNLGWLTDADDWYMTYSFGQSMFTPSDIELTTPPPGERPYAAFLYGGIGIAADSGDKLDVISLEIGMVGPSALGEETQKLVHNIIESTEPEGWDTQLQDEPAFRLAFERKYKFGSDIPVPFFDLAVDFTPHFNVSLGTVDTSAGAGGTFRIGQDLADDYGPPRVRPAVSSPGFFRDQDGFSWYVFAGVESRLVARNLFIEGNTYKGVKGLEPRRLVGDLQIGAAVQIGKVEVAYSHVIRTEEYETQDGLSEFGSFNLRFKF